MNKLTQAIRKVLVVPALCVYSVCAAVVAGVLCGTAYLIIKPIDWLLKLTDK